MIKHIQSSSAMLQCSSQIGPWVGSNGQMAGQLRFNTSTQSLEAYDGISWIAISQTVNISLGYSVEESIRWVSEKIREEAEVKAMAEKHKAVAAALENLNKAQKQLDATIILSKE